MTALEQDWLALHLVPQLGSQTLQHLLNHFGTAASILGQPIESLIQKAGINRTLASHIRGARTSSSYEIETRLLGQMGVTLLCGASEKYPKPLQEIPNPPSVIYCQGQLSCLSQPSIAFVGSRSCTHYGIKHTKRLIQELAEQIPQLVIISGLARGIDTAAHQAALDSGLSTIAVLAGGLQHIYPPENQYLAETIKEQGLLISEFPLALKPLSKNFPIRNRVISGLSQGVVVVEATEKSGALITARFALQHNREVFALPGDVDSPSSYGSHQLISESQAKLIVSAHQILEELQLTPHKAYQVEFSFPPSLKTVTLDENFPLPLRQIIDLLSSEKQLVDSLLEQTQQSIQDLMANILQLELQGFIRMVSGTYYELTAQIHLPHRSRSI